MKQKIMKNLTLGLGLVIMLTVFAVSAFADGKTNTGAASFNIGGDTYYFAYDLTSNNLPIYVDTARSGVVDYPGIMAANPTKVTYNNRFTVIGSSANDTYTITYRGCSILAKICSFRNENNGDTIEVAITTSTSGNSTTVGVVAHIRGSGSAQITLEEWVDYSDPYGKKFEPTIQKILNDYQGKVNLIVKDFPIIQIFPNSEKGAEAAECAAAQGNDYFWNLHDWFMQRTQWSVDEIREFTKLMSYSGFDVSKFNYCLDNDKMKIVVRSYVNEGQSKSVSGIPTTFVIRNSDGKTLTVTGAVSYEELKKQIDSLLQADSNRAPVITGTGGPTQVNVGDTGTWTVNAYDPENGNLYYSIDWNDYSAPTSNTNIKSTTTQTNTFQHTYYDAGTYTITFEVSDDKGADTKATTTVTVVGKTEELCVDTDGLDYYTKGKAGYGSSMKVDTCTYCTGLCVPGQECKSTCGAVVEYYCSGSDIQSTTYVCPNGCYDGACISGNTNTTINISNQPNQYTWDNFFAKYGPVETFHGDNPIPGGYVPNPGTYGDLSNNAVPKYVYRVYLSCDDKIDRKERITTELGYRNYICGDRKQQQCFDDGSYDNYYIEYCDYEGRFSNIRVDLNINLEGSDVAKTLKFGKNDWTTMSRGQYVLKVDHVNPDGSIVLQYGYARLNLGGYTDSLTEGSVFNTNDGNTITINKIYKDSSINVCPVENVLCVSGTAPETYFGDDGCWHARCVAEKKDGYGLGEKIEMKKEKSVVVNGNLQLTLAKIKENTIRCVTTPCPGNGMAVIKAQIVPQIQYGSAATAPTQDTTSNIGGGNSAPSATSTGTTSATNPIAVSGFGKVLYLSEGKSEDFGGYTIQLLSVSKESAVVVVTSGSGTIQLGTVSLSMDDSYNLGDTVNIYAVNNMDKSIYYYGGPCDVSFTVSRGNDDSKQEQLLLQGPVRCMAASYLIEIQAGQKALIGTWDMTYYNNDYPVVAGNDQRVDKTQQKINPGNYFVTFSYGNDASFSGGGIATKKIKVRGNEDNFAETCPAGCKEVAEGCLCPKIRVKVSSGQLKISSDDENNGANVRSIRIEPGSKTFEAQVTTNIGDVKRSIKTEDQGAFIVPVATSSGQVDVSFEAKSETLQTIVSANNAQANTRESLVYENNKLYISKDGDNKEIKVLPEAASQKAAENLDVKISNIELKDNGKAVYEASGQKEGKVFGIIPVSYGVKTQISADNGSVQSTEKPWYDFMVQAK